MALNLIDPTTTELRHLAMVQVKFSGVHLGGGIYLTANHYPKVGGTSNATPQRGLDGESLRHSTTEYDFTMPADTTLWPNYDDSDGDPNTLDPVLPGYDIAMHVDDRTAGTWYSGPAAPMLIAADSADLIGLDATIVGYPKTPPNGAANYSTPYETTGVVGGYIDYNVDGDLGGAWDIQGAEVVDGMSGSGTWVNYTTPDGAAGEYLIGTVSRSYTIDQPGPNDPQGAISADLSKQYADLALSIESLSGDAARSADDFARNVLLAGQTLGSTATTVQGQFFHEDIWGGPNNDSLLGAGGDDAIWGGDGDDFIDGGTGADTMTGGVGADFFRGFGGATDIVADFSAIEDVIDLSDFFGSIEAVRAAAIDNGDGSITIDLSLGTGSGELTGQLIVFGVTADQLTTTNTLVFCFDGATRISTPRGQIRADRLRVGDVVLTLDGGASAIKWIGQRHVSRDEAALHDGLASIEIAAGALGPDLPRRKLRVSPQHRVLVSGAIAQRMTGSDQVFLRAKDLLACEGVRAVARDVDWVHLLLASHDCVDAEGIAAETLHPGAMARAAMSAEQRDALDLMFAATPAPELCRPALGRNRAARLLARHQRNARPLGCDFAALREAATATASTA